MFRIGCHISSAGGYLAMAKRAEALGANTFAFFTRNPRGGSAKPIEDADIAAFHAECAHAGIDRLVAHAPYTLNPCAAKPNVAEFARMAFSDDLQRMEHTPGQLYNFHPGSHVGQGIDAGIEKIAALLNEVLFPDMTTTVLLETMAGKGSEVGGRFEQLRAIIDRVELREHIGVCLETVVLLSHKKPDGHINVKVEFGEGEGKVPLDNIAKRAESYKPKERVTYKMIKEYIEAKYGFKVHTAYIAEVKRDLGLPMYDAPNAVEELKQPRKHPTAEKVEAIKDALKHFEVI